MEWREKSIHLSIHPLHTRQVVYSVSPYSLILIHFRDTIIWIGQSLASIPSSSYSADMSKAAYDRLRKELVLLLKHPVDHIEALPREDNILEW